MSNLDKMTEEQKELAEKNHNLIYGFMHKYDIDEDYYDILAIALCEAAMTYRPELGHKFTTWAYSNMNLAYCCENKKSIRRDRHFHKDDVEDFTNLYSDDSAHLALEFRDSIERALKQFNKRDRSIIYESLIEHKTQEDIGKEFKLSHSTICKILQQFKEQWRKEYEIL